MRTKMISAWNLLWIIPVTSLASLFALAMCSAGGRNEDYSNGYHQGYQDAMNSKSEGGL